MKTVNVLVAIIMFAGHASAQNCIPKGASCDASNNHCCDGRVCTTAGCGNCIMDGYVAPTPLDCCSITSTDPSMTNYTCETCLTGLCQTNGTGMPCCAIVVNGQLVEQICEGDGDIGFCAACPKQGSRCLQGQCCRGLTCYISVCGNCASYGVKPAPGGHCCDGLVQITNAYDTYNGSCTDKKDFEPGNCAEALQICNKATYCCPPSDKFGYLTCSSGLCCSALGASCKLGQCCGDNVCFRSKCEIPKIPLRDILREMSQARLIHLAAIANGVENLKERIDEYYNNLISIKL